MNSGERKAVSLGERWRREATRDVDDARLAAALEALPSIRKPMVRIRAGSIRCEMEGTMGSIHEVSLQIRTLPMRDWNTLVRVLRRSKSIVEALDSGRVPRSFDRLVARIIGEPLFPDARSVTFGCSCDLPEKPCRHVLALHELFARRLDERPWEILMLRGVDLQAMLSKVRQTEPDGELPPLAFGVPEEPVLYPDAEDADLGQTLTPVQVRWFTGVLAERCVESALKALADLAAVPPPPPPQAAAPAPPRRESATEAAVNDVARVKKA
ncbi:MAG: hypothetical protein WAT39_03335 [Planctomycetota bacterium]